MEEMVLFALLGLSSITWLLTNHGEIPYVVFYRSEFYTFEDD